MRRLVERWSAAPARQRAALASTAHRPWPLPARPWVMGQSWDDLLFAHWRVPAGRLEPFVPPVLRLERHQGDAWLGVTPFMVTGLHGRGAPPLPPIARFREVNVRTYVTDGTRPGILFLSLDAASALAVVGARAAYRLPYYLARGGVRSAAAIRFHSERVLGRDARLTIAYRPDGPVFTAAPGSLEHFLTERYCVYSVGLRGLLRSQIHHPPWPLQPAVARIVANTLPPPEIGPLDGEPLVHFSRRQDVLVWTPERVGGGG
jgi:uncharacterized protein YqjF (DUF2071 family)